LTAEPSGPQVHRASTRNRFAMIPCLEFFGALLWYNIPHEHLL
jgi:hypothetical protein